MDRACPHPPSLPSLVQAPTVSLFFMFTGMPPLCLISRFGRGCSSTMSKSRGTKLLAARPSHASLVLPPVSLSCLLSFPSARSICSRCQKVDILAGTDRICARFFFSSPVTNLGCYASFLVAPPSPLESLATWGNSTNKPQRARNIVQVPRHKAFSLRCKTPPSPAKVQREATGFKG